MLKQLKIENFTVFPKADFEFSPGLNVIVGENGTGKSHVLKLAYAIITKTNELKKGSYDQLHTDENETSTISYIGKLINVFRVESIDSLSRKFSDKTIKGFNTTIDFHDSSCRFDFQFKIINGRGNFNVYPISKITDYNAKKSVFFPTRELLSIYPGFVSLYEARYLEFEETYRDTCLLLGEPLLKQPMTYLISVLEEAMGGKVKLENGRFYLITPEQGKLEMSLVAEGLRKLAMLAQLIAVGALQKGGYLFWDEPEANLNPRLIKVVARVILQLAKAGIQIFIATHSLFLLRELTVLQAAEKKLIPQRYFALKQTADGVAVEQGDTVEDLQTLVLLDEELQQSDRYMALEP